MMILKRNLITSIKAIMYKTLLVSLSAFSLLIPKPGQASDELIMGSVAMDTPAVMYKRLKPLTEYLSSKLDKKIILKLSANMKEAITEVASNNVHLSYLTPVAYLKAHKKGNSRLVAKTVTKGKSSFQLMIIVKNDSPYKNINDLIGKSFAFGDPAALLQRAVVVGSGLKLKDFSTVRYLGHYDNIARGVYSGDFDAGILKDTLAFKWQQKGLRVLYASPQLPPYNIVVNGKFDDALYKKIVDAFLKLDSKNPEHLKIIKALDKKYTGFAATNDKEYDVVRKLIAPFNK